MPDIFVTSDYAGRRVRLTDIRWAHILERRIEFDQREDVLVETIEKPQMVVQSPTHARRQIHHRQRAWSSASLLYVAVVVEYRGTSGEVITAFRTAKLTLGDLVYARSW